MRVKIRDRTRGVVEVVPATRVAGAIEVTAGPATIPLASPRAIDPSITGAKASALARALTAGFPVLDGFVITTETTEAIVRCHSVRKLPREILAEIEASWRLMSHDGGRALVVRSSSTAEDGDSSSMAGMFTSILDVASLDSFLDAVDEVLASRKIVDLKAVAGPSPIAVLVQPQLDADKGGIMFGIDPVSGDPKRISVVAAAGGPDALVSGRVEGEAYVMSPRGRSLERPHGSALLARRDLKRLAKLADRARTHFGRAQDVEWAISKQGILYMFQSRPVTAVAARGQGPTLGPGPVAETFPAPLTVLEQDIWIEPLREAVIEALRLTGSASGRALSRSPVVTIVGGRVAADLELFGIAPGKRSLWSRIDPVPPARRLGAAWRVGRMRAALPLISMSIVEQTDERLAAVPDLRELTNEQLVNVIQQARITLRSLHGFEILCGMLGDEGQATGAAIALRSLALARSEGFAAGTIVEDHPEVLALTPPAIKAGIELPTATSMDLACDPPDVELGPREALRLRIRWVQELSARTAWELGRRLVPTGALSTASKVAHLRIDELATMVRDGSIPEGLEDRAACVSTPLPAAFKIAEDGTIVPERTGTTGQRARGAGGGRGMGKVTHSSQPQHGDVLVVRTLDPGLAPLLPYLGGLIAETGNVLSHLAILAREFGVPTVVGAGNALERFPEGTMVVVDGSSGEISEVTPV
jgi:phosphohistidine swiveling domain-containing protein